MASPAPSPKSKVKLIPWDPECPDHRERLRLQRLACGWKYTPDWLDKWSRVQKEGKIALQWIVLEDEDPEKSTKLVQHTTVYPQESTTIVDSAATLVGKPRSSSLQPFIPVGHISLDTTYEEPSKVPAAENGEGIYWISTFYVSQALQRYGLGRAAMDWVEQMAAKEPLSARVLKLSTVALDGTDNGAKNEARLKAMGRPDELKVSVQHWYARRGFEVFQRKEAMWVEVDSTGQQWPINAVLMRKEIK